MERKTYFLAFGNACFYGGSNSTPSYQKCYLLYADHSAFMAFERKEFISLVYERSSTKSTTNNNPSFSKLYYVPATPSLSLYSLNQSVRCAPKDQGVVMHTKTALDFFTETFLKSLNQHFPIIRAPTTSSLCSFLFCSPRWGGEEVYASAALW